MQTNKVVPFRNRDGISYSLTQRLLAKGCEYGLTAIFPFSIDKIEVAEWVRLKCHYGCSRFGSNWTCPPATPGIGALLAKGAAFTDEAESLVIALEEQHALQADGALPAAHLADSFAAVVQVKIRTVFRPDQQQGGIVFSQDRTRLVRARGRRFPQEKRPSVESFSIDVIGTLNNLGTTSKIATQTSDTYNYYGMILLE